MQEFTKERALDFDIFAVAEHHQPGSQPSRMRQSTPPVHRRRQASVAIATGRSETGTSGGVGIFPKNHISLQPYGEPRKELHQHCLDLAMCQLRPRGDDINYIQTYSETAVEPEGNHQRYATLAGETLCSRMPFVLVGDFNVTPEPMQTASFFCKMKASCVVTSEGQASCRSGRLLDDIVASSEILSAPAQVEFTPAPWKTYDSLGSFGSQLRRCEWSRVLIGPLVDLIFLRYSPPEGPLQTVPCSDLAAVIYTLGHKPCELTLETTLDVRTEQRNASKIHAPDRMDKSKAEGHPALFSDDGDLWSDFLQALQK